MRKEYNTLMDLAHKVSHFLVEYGHLYGYPMLPFRTLSLKYRRSAENLGSDMDGLIDLMVREKLAAVHYNMRGTKYIVDYHYSEQIRDPEKDINMAVMIRNYEELVKGFESAEGPEKANYVPLYSLNYGTPVPDPYNKENSED